MDVDQSNEPLEYEQQINESSPAFRAFVIYRDLGPLRSIAKAYTQVTGGDSRPPGQWGKWSVQHSWETRAVAYDAHCDAEKRKVRERKMLELDERRFTFELRNQEAQERRVDRMDNLIDLAEKIPLADSVVVKEEVEESIGLATMKKTKTKATVKALKMSGYAKTIQVRNETARFAIVGVRDPKTNKEVDKTSTKVTRIVFRPKVSED